jgi:hypothetical protein
VISPRALIGDLVSVIVPEFIGEHATGVILRGGRGRWQRVGMGTRERAERAVRFLRRNRVAAWIRPAGPATYEVIVRTEHAEIARGLLNARG